jgi:hypothetical protein
MSPLPIDRPGKIVCVGLNYRDHAEEQGTELPGAPLLFAKWPNALLGPGEPSMPRAGRGDADSCSIRRELRVQRMGEVLRERSRVVRVRSSSPPVSASATYGRDRYTTPADRGS